MLLWLVWMVVMFSILDVLYRCCYGLYGLTLSCVLVKSSGPMKPYDGELQSEDLGFSSSYLPEWEMKRRHDILALPGDARTKLLKIWYPALGHAPCLYSRV